MRVPVLSLVVLAAGCMDVPERTELLDPVCHVGESVAVDATGAACPAAQSPIPYSMLGPNVMLLVDRSGSMSGFKWSALQSLTPYLPAVGERSNLGLAVFPGPDADGCGTADSIVVPMTEGNEAVPLVSDALATISPDGMTPLAAGLQNLAESGQLQCSNRDNVVVLLSDGAESCSGDPVQAARDLVSGEVPVELFVIGFGVDEQTSSSLRRVAEAAESTTGPDNYYTAETVDDLLARLYAVTSTCTAQLDFDVLPEQLLVTLDGRAVPECLEDRCEQGFTYDLEHSTVRLEGEDCLAILDGTCHDLSFSD